tara:strand:- start:1243 stop:2154 length:912 start_codon:yes stop_codon:yes gene_type:complete
MVTFSPFMQSATAQDIINSYINKPYQTPPAINPIFDLREPGQEFPPLNPPVQTDPVVDPCPPGYQLIDGVCQPIDQFGGDMPNEVTGGGDNENIDTRSESRKLFDDMKNDPSNMFGATRFLDKYEIGEDEFGNPIYSFDPKKGVFPFFGMSLIDTLTGGGKRREDKFNQAINTILSQTQNQDVFGNLNPLAFGKQSGDIFTMYNPQQYLDQTKDVVLQQTNQQPVTMGDMIGSLNTGTASQVQSQGTEPVDVRGSSLVITDDGVRRRDDTAYQSAVAKNIARNIANTGSSGFSTTLGGFTRGR